MIQLLNQRNRVPSFKSTRVSVLENYKRKTRRIKVADAKGSQESFPEQARAQNRAPLLSVWTKPSENNSERRDNLGGARGSPGRNKTAGNYSNEYYPECPGAEVSACRRRAASGGLLPDLSAINANQVRANIPAPRNTAEPGLAAVSEATRLAELTIARGLRK